MMSISNSTDMGVSMGAGPLQESSGGSQGAAGGSEGNEDLLSSMAEKLFEGMSDSDKAGFMQNLLSLLSGNGGAEGAGKGGAEGAGGAGGGGPAGASEGGGSQGAGEGLKNMGDSGMNNSIEQGADGSGQIMEMLQQILEVVAQMMDSNQGSFGAPQGEGQGSAEGMQQAV